MIALLSAVSDWISKRRAAKAEDGTLPVPSAGGSESRGPAPGHRRRKVPKLFEHLEKELKRLAEDSPVVEVLETSASRTRNNPEIFGGEHRATFGDPDPFAAQKKKLAEAAVLKKEAAAKLAKAKKLTDRIKKSPRPVSAHGIPHIGVSHRNLRHWVRNSAQLRTAIALNTILETPKGLQSGSQGNADRGF